MISPVVGRKAFLPFIACASLMLGACSNNERNMRNTLERMDIPAKEINDAVSRTKNRDKFVEEVQMQSAIDSIAYRKIFEATDLAKDSIPIKEFNAIAAKTALKNYVSAKYPNWFNSDRCIDRMLEIINSDDYDEGLTENMKYKCLELDDKKNKPADYQKCIDAVYYENFFKGYGVFEE